MYVDIYFDKMEGKYFRQYTRRLAPQTWADCCMENMQNPKFKPRQWPKLHRLNGPAAIMYDEGKNLIWEQWWINGKVLDPLEVEQWLRNNKIDLTTNEGQFAFKLTWA